MAVSWTSALRVTPSAKRIATVENYATISGITGLNTIDKPEIRDSLIRTYGDQGLTGFIRAIGAFVPVGADKKEWYEEVKLHNATTLVVKAADAAVINTGNDVVWEFASDSTIRLFDVLRIGDTIVYVTAITAIGGADEVTVAPYKVWKANYAAAAEAVATIVGNDYAKFTDQPAEWVESNVKRRESPFAIIKEKYAIGGSSMANYSWVRVPAGKANQGGWVWFLKGENDQRSRFENYTERQMIEAEVATNAVVTALGVTGTEGLFSAIKDRGIHGDGKITAFAELQVLAQELENERGAAEYTIWSSILQTQAFDDLLKTETAIGGATSYGLFNNSEEMALNLGFSGFKNSGYDFYYKKWKLANESEMLGAHAGFNAVFIPADHIMDAKSEESIPSFSIGYKAAEGYSREIETFLQGSANLPIATNTVDTREVHYRTERLMCTAGANRYAMV